MEGKRKREKSEKQIDSNNKRKNWKFSNKAQMSEIPTLTIYFLFILKIKNGIQRDKLKIYLKNAISPSKNNRNINNQLKLQK